MEVHSSLPIKAEAVLANDKSGAEMHLLIAKATFDIPVAGSTPRPSEHQFELVYADEYYGEPGLSSIKRAYDFPLEKPKIDVLVTGSAHAVGNVPTKAVDVTLRIGSRIDKTIRVVGQRHWDRSVLGGYRPSEPRPFVVMPLTYELAYGGSDVTLADPKRHVFHRDNLIGVGLHANSAAEVVLGKPLPSLTHPRHPYDAWGDSTPTMGFGPICPAWLPRADFAGTYDEAYFRDRFPLLPADFDSHYHQTAPADQQLTHVAGDEFIELINLSPRGHLRFKLPHVPMPVVFFFSDGREERYQAKLDTIHFEPDEMRFTMTWRLAVRCVGKPYDLREVTVGEMSERWWRRHRSFKSHYESLAHLVKARSMG